MILSPLDDLYGRLAVLSRLFQAHSTLAKVHEHLIDRQPVQPGCEGRLTAKATDLAKELNKNFLREILGIANVSRHPQAQRIHAAVVTQIKLLEGLHVASTGGL